MVSNEMRVDSNGILQGSREGCVLQKSTFGSLVKGKYDRQTAPVKRTHHRSPGRNHPVRANYTYTAKQLVICAFMSRWGIREVPDFSWADR